MDGLGSFEGFRLDRSGLFRLDRAGAAVPVAASPRSLDLLAFLIRHCGELVSKDQIMKAVWPGVVVGEGNLTVQISALRRILDRNRKQGSCIQTIAGRGYRFVGPLTQSEADPHCAILAATEPPARPRPRLSIVVLPFTNLSDDREQQYFADGITEDLTTDLSRIPGMFVISRNTAFTYRDKPIDAKQIGRALGVGYALEGNVRRSDSHVRVNAQLIDTETAAHLWAERFDGDKGDLFALQNEVTSRIAVALDVELVDAEAARPTEHPDALDYILRGRAATLGPPTRAQYAKRLSLYERALALDPGSVEAQSLLASVLTHRVHDEMADTPAVDLARAEALLEQALATSPRSPRAHLAKGHLLRAQGRPEEAIPEYEAVIAFNRNWATALSHLGWCKLLTGSIQEAITFQQRAIRLSPRDPYICIWYFRIGLGHLFLSRIDEAIAWSEKARGANWAHPSPHGYLAGAYGLEGWTERAAAELAEARRLSDHYSNIARLKAAGQWGLPAVQSLFETTYFAGLRKAGMPEE
ncbi:MAG: winged helix-turn-helix domain-containing protein [Alphaproteobacteria bacterium]|nr:winged helix-turn-helix domain-containing protein [Alphaproteobacteria bacterium]